MRHLGNVVAAAVLGMALLLGSGNSAQAEEPVVPDPTPTPTQPATTESPDPVATTKPVTKRPTAQAVNRRRITIGINAKANGVFVRGEKFWVRGRVYSAANRPVGHKKLTLYAYVGARIKKLAVVRTKANGTYAYAVRPTYTTGFKALIGTLKSPKVKAVRTTAPRTLAQRASELGFALGAPAAGAVTRGTYTYRRYTHGMLVQTGTRTWLVRGDFRSEYLKVGGTPGRLGVPSVDEMCGLKEGACIQRFAGGAIYRNARAKDRVTHAFGARNYANLAATALSQVGYREPSPRKSKYSKWMKRTGPADAWCGYFASWVSAASGHGTAVVKAKSYASMVRAERKRGRTTKQPAIGRLAYTGYFRKGVASHVGIVVKYDATHVWTVEGNVSSGGGMKHPRGVHVVKRTRSWVVFYANPRF